MSTDISEIMFELEQAGVPEDRVELLVRKLLIAGERAVWASIGELAGKRLVTLVDVERLLGGLAALGPNDLASKPATLDS